MGLAMLYSSEISLRRLLLISGVNKWLRSMCTWDFLMIDMPVRGYWVPNASLKANKGRKACIMQGLLDDSARKSS